MNCQTRTVWQILIADDHALVRDGLKMVLQQLATETPISFLEASDYRGVSEQIRLHPNLDLAIIDLQMPGAQHGDSLMAISQNHPRLPLLVVSAFSSPDVVQKVLKLPSVHAFVSKGASHACVLAAVRACLEGHKAGEITDVPANEPASAVLENSLSPRLAAVHSLLRIGKSNKQIAYELNLSEGTVKNYMSEIFRYLKVVNRTQAARIDENAPI